MRALKAALSPDWSTQNDDTVGPGLAVSMLILTTNSDEIIFNNHKNAVVNVVCYKL